ncbi:MAG: hypothetical protein K0Q55_3310 [Verrucomicrobia bacterium]|nr:hypothetical protein [Verrucomicrobiota bacterium]
MRSFWKYAMVVFLVLTGTGCVASYQLISRTGTLKKLPEGRYLPARPEFTVQPEVVATSAGIDFEAVYHLDHTYLRFWPDGKVIRRFVGNRPMSDEADQFDSGKLGYYQVKDGKVVMEFFAPQPVDFRWTYWTLKGEIQGDQIRLVREEWNRKSEAKDVVYTKHPVKGMKRMPDW